MSDFITLYRPVGPIEFGLILMSNYKKFPPRLPSQPIFYPVCNEQYAEEITRKWNVSQFGLGYVLKFNINKDFISKYKKHIVGSRIYEEYWIPAEDLEELNNSILGDIETVSLHR